MYHMYSAMFLLGMASKVSCKIFLYSKLPITYIQARLLEAAVNRHSPQSIFYSQTTACSGHGAPGTAITQEACSQQQACPAATARQLPPASPWPCVTRPLPLLSVPVIIPIWLCICTNKNTLKTHYFIQLHWILEADHIMLHRCDKTVHPTLRNTAG